jgi:hypothetical protein
MPGMLSSRLLAFQTSISIACISVVPIERLTTLSSVGWDHFKVHRTAALAEWRGPCAA